MNRQVVSSEPLRSFVRRLAPEPRWALKKALKELQRERGDIEPLEQALIGYYRLRVGRFRVIFRYRDDRTIEALFAEERSIVYEVFEEQFLRKLSS